MTPFSQVLLAGGQVVFLRDLPFSACKTQIKNIIPDFKTFLMICFPFQLQTITSGRWWLDLKVFKSETYQIKRVFEDNQGIIFVILHKNVCCAYSLESPQWGDSNEYPQHVFLWRTVENYPLIILKYPPYLLHWKGTVIFTSEKRIRLVFGDNFNGDNFPYFSIKHFVVVLNALESPQYPQLMFSEVILMCTHNVSFYGEL